MLMGMVITFPGNYCVGEGNTINKSISISLYLLNASCSLNEITEKIRQVDLISRLSDGTSEKMTVLPIEGYFL
jgi:hypothetical protein